jgi:hypothetical protein
VEKAQRPAGTGTEKASDGAARALAEEKATAERLCRRRRQSGTTARGWGKPEADSASRCVFFSFHRVESREMEAVRSK